MTRATIGVWAFAIAIFIVLLALAARRQTVQPAGDSAAATPTAIIVSTQVASQGQRGFIYGRVTTDDGSSYEGQLRWGGDEEAFWGDYFNGFKEKNPWVAYVPPERLKEHNPLTLFGVKIALWEPQINLGRPFMARFGDIARIEPDGGDLRVTLKSGTLFHLDRFGADDIGDGLRVWDSRSGVVDLDDWQIRSVEFLPTARLGATSERLHGTVRTQLGDFTGFIQWNRQGCVGSDEIHGRTANGEASLPFDTIRSIERDSRDSSLVKLLDGREMVLSGTREAGQGNRGIHVDDPRYGRVLISWDAFERLDFSPSDNGPTYDDFPPGSPLVGSVTTHAGRRLAGRLVYDLDESETTETLDAPFQGVNYNIPFGLIASIVLPDQDESDAQQAQVTLHSGEKLQLERSGDLGEGNGGILIFVDGQGSPEYVPWTEVEQVELDRPTTMYPPLGLEEAAQ